MTTINPEWAVMHRFSVEDYHRMGETGIFEEKKVELLYGNIVDMSPINSDHAGTVKRLNQILSNLLQESHILSVQDPIQLDDYSEPEPDLAILNYRQDFYTHSHPTAEEVNIIIEVAGSSLEKDQKVKLPLYASAGIPEVWIVNLLQRQIERYRKPTEKGYTDIRILLPGDRIETDWTDDLEVSAILGDPDDQRQPV